MKKLYFIPGSQDLYGEECLLSHLQHRQELELKICREVFPGHFTVLPSKKYSDFIL